MSREGLTRMTKIEVVVGADDVPVVRGLLEAAQVKGWTSVSNVSGLGHGGLHEGNLLFNQRDTLSLLLTVVPDEQSDAVVAGLRELLADRSGVMFVSDTYVSRPEHFR